MEAIEIARLRSNPAFAELAARRSRLSWGLTIAILAIYGGFLFLVAFEKSLLARPIGSGPMTLAFPLGLGVILAAIALTGIYVTRANTVFDRLTTEIVAGHR